MTRQSIAQNQPVWVCGPCGRMYGLWYENGTYIGPDSHIATWHIGGTCGVCKQKTIPVTEARDFGYLISGWQPRLLTE